MPVAAGVRLGPYEIQSLIGAGGMGEVYRARDTRLDRTVAIKVLPSDLASDPDRRSRFEREAKTIAALAHPHICMLHDVGEQDGTPFLVMEYLEGETLAHRLFKGHIPLPTALEIATQMADALAAAHEHGVVHRDLKPANIMVDEHGRVKLLDFGLAKLLEPLGGEMASTRSLAVQTGEGRIVGTVAYMSPEQAQGRLVDARSDAFSFGAVLYEMITGRRAFQGDTGMSTVAAVINQEPQPTGPEVPRDLARIITRCLRKNPDRRFQHMIDLKVALEELKEESDSGTLGAAVTPPRRRRWWPAAGLGIVALTSLVALFLLRNKVPYNPAQSAKATRLTADSGLTTEPALSQDGKLVVFASDRAGRATWTSGFRTWRAARRTS